MRPRLDDERGMALTLAVFAIVVIGALVAGAFFAGSLEQRLGGAAVHATQATEAADRGLGERMAATNATILNALVDPTTATGTSTVAYAATTAGNVDYATSVQRLNTSLFLVRSTGRRLAPNGTVLATASLAQMIRIWKPTVSVNAAITVTDDIKANGNAFNISGENSVPTGWTTTGGSPDCPAPSALNTDDLVGVRSAGNHGLSNGELNNVSGYPVKAQAHDPSITSATFNNFLDYTFTSLGSQPDVKVLPATTPYSPSPVVTSGVCDKTVLLNLGQPARDGTFVQCQPYFPVVHGTGAQTKFASGAKGQGILLVDGDLEIAGGFEWSGLVIVRGSFKITGNGNKITGALLAEGLTGDNTLGGNVTVNYSACAISKAVAGASAPEPVGSRAWVQL